MRLYETIFDVLTSWYFLFTYTPRYTVFCSMVDVEDHLMLTCMTRHRTVRLNYGFNYGKVVSPYIGELCVKVRVGRATVVLCAIQLYELMKDRQSCGTKVLN